MSNNDWELYECHPDFTQAYHAIEVAWREAKSLAPDKPSQERARLAEQHVYKVMQRWDHVGATDTESRWMLSYRVRKHFGCEGGSL
jgi:hypothetical protein